MAPECSCSPISDSPPRRRPTAGRCAAASAAPAAAEHAPMHAAPAPAPVLVVPHAAASPALAPAALAAGAAAERACAWALARADGANEGGGSGAGAAPAAWAGAHGSDHPTGRPAMGCGELLSGMRLGPAAPGCAAWGGPRGGRQVVCRLAPAPPPHFVGVRAAAAAAARGGCGGAVLHAQLGAPSADGRAYAFDEARKYLGKRKHGRQTLQSPTTHSDNTRSTCAHALARLSHTLTPSEIMHHVPAKHPIQCCLRADMHSADAAPSPPAMRKAMPLAGVHACMRMPQAVPCQRCQQVDSPCTVALQ
jgi:hypothetical protein